MKKITCKQLGGACEKKFHADRFDEMAKKSREHGKEMAEKDDKKYLEAMEKMKEKSEEEMKEWMAKKKEEFEDMPTD